MVSKVVTCDRGECLYGMCQGLFCGGCCRCYGFCLMAADMAHSALRMSCPTSCDDDCEQTCHECHQVPVKRTHVLDSCQRLEGPEWAIWMKVTWDELLDLCSRVHSARRRDTPWGLPQVDVDMLDIWYGATAAVVVPTRMHEPGFYVRGPNGGPHWTLRSEDDLQTFQQDVEAGKVVRRD